MRKRMRPEPPKQARKGYCFVVLCESCGELKRRKYRSDAIEWQRRHLEEHEVQIIERPLV